MPNRLAQEKSPYLLQHAHNPVDWHPWGREALERAQREDKPILLSIGYSACHWCHVMAHESFENDAIARLMNENLVNIKVDREERPDVDSIYMEAVQALTGHGGWPLNVFLTPDGRPFYGGTYFPPQPRHGMPSWPQVVESVAHAYQQQRSDVLKNAATLTEYVRQVQHLAPSYEILSPEILKSAYRGLASQFDWDEGGFGGAPKFPQPLALEFLLRICQRFSEQEAKKFVELTLHKMADGGLFDQLAGGFHRYTVDAHWVVPHFEKMLYDNALLARVYLQAWQVTCDPWYRSIVERTLDYMLGELCAPEGGFYSAQDADSEGVEGKYYVWTPSEFEQILGPEVARVAALRFGVTPQGNFEGKTVLTLAASLADIVQRTGLAEQEVEHILDEARRKLLAARAQRVAPGKDTKIITSWNALAIRALAEAGRVFDRPDYLEAARQAFQFIWHDMRTQGRLVRSYKDGPSSIPGFLDDYSFLAEALIALYQATFEVDYLTKARSLIDEMVQSFWDDAQGAFFDSMPGLEELVARPRTLFDNPIPSGNSAATFALLRLEALTGETVYAGWALPAIRAGREFFAKAPSALPYLLSALDFYLSPQRQIAIVGALAEPETQRMLKAIYGRYLPNAVVAVGEEGAVPLLEGRTRVDGKVTAFVCEHFACKLPVTDTASLVAQLEATDV